ncbi:hypothetical protein LINPERPRIM_LOCUS30168 [Linum perenne]
MNYIETGFRETGSSSSSIGQTAFRVCDSYVASESSFSLGGRVLNKWRTCILSDTLEALMTTRNWLHGYTMDEDEENVEANGEDVSLA